MRLLLLILAILATIQAPARTRAVSSRIDLARRILVITAHPDDEILLAPLLANRCVRGGASCAIVVMSAPGTRAQEMARSAALLNLRLTQWFYSDDDALWGDRPALIQRIADVIAIENPDLILTFDPRHGTTCHPAHREIGRLVLETKAKNIFLIETAARFIGNGFELSNASPAHAWTYVANDDWQYVARVAEIHASQFHPEQVESLRNLPLLQRRVWFAPAGATVENVCD